MSTYQERYAASLMNTFGPPKLVLTRGEGAHECPMARFEHFLK